MRAEGIVVPGAAARSRRLPAVLLAVLAAALVQVPTTATEGVGAVDVVRTGAPAPVTTVQERAYSVAASRLGDPFRYGSAGPHAFDCSGLTSYAYRLAGRPIRRTIADQYRLSSGRIPSSSARRGDLVFFLSHGVPLHVGIYSGNGFVIHANSGSYFGRKVINERISFYWAKHFTVDYRRVR